MDESTGEVDGTQDYLQELRRGPDGRLSHVTVEAITPPPSFRAAYDAIRHADERAGWLNPYLVT